MCTSATTWATPFSRVYQGDRVDWSLGLGRVALILKDTMNRRRTSARRSRGATCVLADAGSTDDGGADQEDAGVRDAALSLDGGSSRDAGRTPDAAGSGGAVTGGCSVRSGRGRDETAAAALLLGLAGLLARRTRRRPTLPVL